MVRLFTMVDGIDKELAKFKNITVQQETEQNVDSEHSTQEFNKDCDDVLLFFSFDIVNSTLYKNVSNYWVYTIDIILKEVKNRIKEKIKIAEVWRVFGDEIIFITNISSEESVGEYISYIHQVLVKCSDFIEKGKCFEGHKIEDKEKLIDHRNMISIKACAWIAAVTDISKIEKGSREISVENIFEIFEEGPNNRFREFRGADIDAGFRLAKETVSRRLTISFELAYLLSNKNDMLKNIRVITYKKLKGVWNNLPYPIIWYYDSSHNGGCSFEDSIPFDAIVQDGIYGDLMTTELYKCSEDKIKELVNKILKERGIQNKIDKLNMLIDYKSDNRTDYLRDLKLELHCVAVCYNEEGKIFLVKRATKEFFSGIWEFGCAKASYDKSISEILKEEYKSDFGIDIEVQLDENRKEDKQPIPLAVYTIKKNNEIHKGIIFIAKIVGNTEVRLDEKKHSEYIFISAEDLKNNDKVNAQDFVPDALDTMYKAFKIIKEKGNENK
ncbi:hypothetical protein [Catonella sp.]|uniref:hypothetical protein n=1 Tax=Catonella sp. TaxID=2382125 RepID=UPI003FA001D9